MPKVIKIIESHITRGSGKKKDEIKYQGGMAAHTLLEDDPFRTVTQYHTLNGEFLAEVDPREELIIGEFNEKEAKNK